MAKDFFFQVSKLWENINDIIHMSLGTPKEEDEMSIFGEKYKYANDIVDENYKHTIQV